MPKLKKKITRDFTTIHNTMLRDMRLGATERGLLLTMLSLPDNWNFSIKGLARILPDGYTKIATALKNLAKNGYLVRRRIYTDGKITDWEYLFSDEPIPFYTKGRQKGLHKGVSMKAALIEEGFDPRGPKENQLVMWEAAERAEMERVLRTHGFERDDRELRRKHLDVDEYKVYQESKKMIGCMKELQSSRHGDLSADRTRELQLEIVASKRRIAELEAERQSPYKAFYYSSPDKQAWVQQQMTRRIFRTAKRKTALKRRHITRKQSAALSRTSEHRALLHATGCVKM
jgi:hypothetical protein